MLKVALKHTKKGKIYIYRQQRQTLMVASVVVCVLVMVPRLVLEMQLKSRYQNKCAQCVSRRIFTTSGTGTVYTSETPEFSPGFSWESCYSIFGFMCNVLQIVVCPFVLFLLVIVLSILLRLTHFELIKYAQNRTICLLYPLHNYPNSKLKYRLK